MAFDPNNPNDLTGMEEVTVTAPPYQPPKMGFNINAFRSSILKNGIIRSHSFLMAIHKPGLDILKKYDERDLIIRCASVNVPGMNLLTADGIFRHGYGPAERVPYGAIFTDVTASFILDRSASQYGFFNSWMQGIYNTDTSNGMFTGQSNFGDADLPFEVGYKNDYATNISIFLYNESSQKVFEVYLQDAFPVQVQDMAVSWDETDKFLTVSVSFSYRNFYIRTVDVAPIDTSSQGVFAQIIGGLIGDLGTQAGLTLNSGLNKKVNKFF